MFTGIVREIGRVQQITRSGDTKIRIGCARPADTIEIGASISCDGVCLTVTAIGTESGSTWFDVEASDETLSKTGLGNWAADQRINLEPAMRLGDELGGHIVSGHVDGIGKVRAITPVGDSHKVAFVIDRALGRFVASKGSITINGISLTVNGVADEPDGTHFDVNIIPHTWSETTMQNLAAGDSVNIEIDLLARYVARLAESQESATA